MPTRPLPEDWDQRRKFVLHRARYRCEEQAESWRCPTVHDPPESILEVHHVIAGRHGVSDDPLRAFQEQPVAQLSEGVLGKNGIVLQWRRFDRAHRCPVRETLPKARPCLVARVAADRCRLRESGLFARRSGSEATVA